MNNGQSNGIMVGTVCDLDDPEKLGRVRVALAHLGKKDNQSDWARVASPMAGADRGFHFLPEKGDEVLLVSEHGDPRRLYVVGALWSRPDKPPRNDGNTTDNNWRFIRSRSGHVIKLDDTRGGEKIEVIDKDENARVVIDAANKKIQVQCDQGDIEVTTGSGAVKVQATTIEISATGELTIKAGTTLTIQGAQVAIN
jgi:phage baseplate assembly protein V